MHRGRRQEEDQQAQPEEAGERGVLQVHASARTCRCVNEPALLDGISASDAIRKAIRLEYGRRVLVEPHL